MGHSNPGGVDIDRKCMEFMAPWLSHELEGLAELALRLMGVFSTWTGKEVAKGLKCIIPFCIFSGVLESSGLLGAGSGMKRHGRP